MAIELNYKKPGDLIRSDEWNKILDELASLRSYIDNMTRSATLTGLASPVGTSYGIGGNVPDEFNYGTEVMGLITRQYFAGRESKSDICRFGLNDHADIISYWSGAAWGDKEAMAIAIEYADGTVYEARDLFIHEWSNLRPRGQKNPYVEYLQSPNQRLWYRYVLVNPSPEKAVRHITFRDTNTDCALRIANVLHYVTRIRPLDAGKK
jgi:hypothetical protein